MYVQVNRTMAKKRMEKERENTHTACNHFFSQAFLAAYELQRPRPRIIRMRSGVRQRLGLDCDNKHRDRSRSPAGDIATARGGVRQRLGLASAPDVTCRKRPRSGGVRQHLSAVAAQARATDTDDTKPFNALLRKQWGAGKFSGPTVCELANAAASQGASGADELGGDSHNSHRHLIAAMGYPETAAEIDWIRVPDQKGEMQSHPILCPIKVIEKMIQDEPEKFNKVLRGVDGDIATFWRNMRGHTIYRKNASIINTTKSMAGSIHGDGAATTNVDGLFTVSWSTFHGSGSTKDTRQVFTVLKKAAMGKESLEVIWKRLAWSFNALAEGRIPLLNWEGKPCPDAGRLIGKGWKLAVIAIRGDWEFYTQACHFPTSTSVPNMCWQCNASPHGHLCWGRGDCRAPWRATLRSHEQYLASLAAQGLQPPAIFEIKTVRIEGVMGDVMHTLDQGVTAHVVGNVMYEVMKLGQWGSTQAEQAAGLNDDLKKHYTATKEQYRIDGKITFTRVRKTGDWPRFLGKAAATRKLANYALELATRYNDGSIHDQRRAGVCKCLVRVYDILDAEPRFMSEGAKRELAELSVVFFNMYSNLSAEALGKEVREWKMSPKFHLMQHILEHQTWINPRNVWTYADEDLQKIMKAVARSSHAMNVPFTVLLKWMVHLHDSAA